jgi:2-oxoglutarate ferredoxin oxidoreductase subunit gamma
MVTISDKPIYSPIFTKADHVIALNEPSYVKYGPIIKDGGMILYNASLIKTPSHSKASANRRRRQRHRHHDREPKVMNMVVLGLTSKRRASSPTLRS